MNTRQLPYILAIAQTGSLSAAAAQLKISQPALSKYLSQLEKEIGLPLFLNNKKHLYPTPAGQIYLDAARQILDLQNQTRYSIKNLNTTERKTLAIGVTPHRGVRALAKCYSAFIKLFPNEDLIPLEGYTTQLREYVIEGRTTCALSTCSDKMDPRVQYLPLYDEELLLCVPTFHRLAGQAVSDINNLTSIDIRYFSDTPFVMMGPETTIWEVSQKMFKQAGFIPTVIYTSNNVQMVNEMLKTGIGVGLVPYYYAEPSTSVVYFRLSLPCYLTFCILTASGHSLTREERYLIYLKIKQDLHNSKYNFHWSDTLRSIMNEFDNMPAFPVGE